MVGAQSSPPAYIPPTEQYVDDTTNPGSVSTENSSPTKQRIKQFRADAKRITKKVLHVDNTNEQIHHDEHAAPHAINDNAGLNPAQTLEVEAGTLKQIQNKLLKPHELKELAHTILHPKDEGAKQASKMLDVSENPHLSREDDDELIDAHDKLKELEVPGPLEFGIAERIAKLHGSIDEMEDDRERKQVAWVSSRYVSGGRVISDASHQFPFLSSCRWVDESGKPQGAQWSQWARQFRSLVHHVQTEKPSPTPDQAASEGDSDEKPDYDQDVLLQQVERIVISSSPIQKWISDLRKLHTWEDPRTTALWLVAWLVIWTCGCFFIFVYLYSAYKILQTRTAFDKRQSLKEAYHRADTDDEVNTSLSELITKYGSTKWLEPVIDSVGPTAQSTLRNVADWSEIVGNFPEAKTRRAKTAVLFTFAVAILITTFASTAFCVRAIELLLILLFFVDQPLARRFPRYRSVILPMHWILWDVPTNTEMSFRYLRQQAQEIRKRGFEQLPASTDGVPPPKADTVETPNLMNIDLVVARCKWGKITGSIVLTSHDMYFMRNFPAQELWRRRFEDIAAMSKGDGPTSLLKQVDHFLEFRYKDGSVDRLERVNQNDQVFNVIFAFSHLLWQQV